MQDNSETTQHMSHLVLGIFKSNIIPTICFGIFQQEPVRYTCRNGGGVITSDDDEIISKKVMPTDTCRHKVVSRT